MSPTNSLERLSRRLAIRIEINIGFPKDILRVIDKQLELLEQDAAECPDSDSFGIIDQGEASIVLGFERGVDDRVEALLEAGEGLVHGARRRA
jgi:hypothetical protein